MTEPHEPERNPDGPTATLLRQLAEHGYSQGYLARALKLPQSRLSRWSNGENTHRADDALRLSELARKLLRRKPRRRAE
jgi:transcriptional regulator with XRE-family HTH domain